MSRRNSYDKELELLDRLKHENKKLKRELASLRKVIDRIDIERYNNLQELVDKQYAEAEEMTKHKSKRQQLKEKWNCHECGKDYLRIIILNRRDGVFYFRKCGTCDHRTKLQKYTDKVEGIMND